MKRIKNIALLLLSLLLIISCGPKDKFEWNAAWSAPKFYGNGGPFVEFFYQGKSIAGASASIGADPGWGLTSGGYARGDIFKPVPDSVFVKWICAIDGYRYEGGSKLPKDKMLDLFKNGRDSKEEKYSQIIAGFAPGGNVTVWMSGQGNNKEIINFKAENKGVWKESEEAEKIEKEILSSDKFINSEVNIYHYLHGVPYSAWEKGDKQYKYDLGFSSEEDYKYSITYYSKDGSVYFLDSTPYFLKWSNRFASYPKNPNPSHQLKLPVQMDLIWHSYDKESRWFEGSVVLPQNLQGTFEKGHYDRMIVTIPKDTGGDFVEGVVYFVNKQKQDQVMRFRLGRFNDEQKKLMSPKYTLPKGFVAPKWEGRIPPSKANRFRILAGRIMFFNGERNKKRTDQKQLFEKHLNPELIGVDVETYSLDLSSDTNLQLSGKYLEGSRMLAYYEDESLIPPAHAPGYLNLVFYLKGKLKVKDEYKYSKHFVAFYLGESGGCKDKSNTYY